MQNPRRSLYSVLGVDKNSSKDVVRRAYRKMAKRLHPDTGGSQESFALIKKAHDILTDDKRRAKYDDGGEESDVGPDNTHGNAVNIVAGAFNQVLQECASAGRSPLEIDMISAMRGKINSNIAELQKPLRINKNILETDKKMKGRFKSKKKNNVLEDILAFRVSSLLTAIAQSEEQLKSCNAALEILDGVTFRCDPKIEAEPGATNFPFQVFF